MPDLSQSGHSCAILPAIDGTVDIDNSSPPVSLNRCIATLQLTAVHRDPTWGSTSLDYDVEKPRSRKIQKNSMGLIILG